MTAKPRSYPTLSVAGQRPRTPISFVVVRFSDEYLHNFLPSKCANDPINEVVVVDNRGNLFFDNLSSAIDHGVKQAKHDLIAVVHEDVFLVDGWQVRFEQSLAQLEERDACWGMVGSVGNNSDGALVGHWSDPFQYENTFDEPGRDFCEVEQLDEQILIFHRHRLPKFDVQLPGIHHVGRDLSNGLREKGLRTYAINAPTIHKFKDRNGQLVLSHDESEKIQDRKSLTYLADKACCDNYVVQKWPMCSHIYNAPGEFEVPFDMENRLSQLDSPIVLLSRGGSGSRLLSLLAADLGIFLGNELNESGDSMEMVIPVYRAITEKYRCKADWQKEQPVKRLRAAAARMIQGLRKDAHWGFKLPESMLILPEIQEAFPKARFIHLLRDPLTTCLRRTHMTARLDNHIGRIALPLAYDFLGRPREKILDDDPVLHMAYTTRHQLALAWELNFNVAQDRLNTVRFENLIKDPRNILIWLGARLGLEPKTHKVRAQVDPGRARSLPENIPANVVRDVEKALAETRAYWGYETKSPKDHRPHQAHVPELSEQNKQELEKLRGEIALHIDRIEAMGNSLSWKVTAPLRFIFDWLVIYPKELLGRLANSRDNAQH